MALAGDCDQMHALISITRATVLRESSPSNYLISFLPGFELILVVWIQDLLGVIKREFSFRKWQQSLASNISTGKR
jgi:hypothetical protein